MTKRKIDLCRWAVEAEGVAIDGEVKMIMWCEWGSWGAMRNLPRPASFDETSFFQIMPTDCRRCKPPFFERKKL